MDTMCNIPNQADIMDAMKPRENVNRFAMLLDNDLKRDLIEVQHRLRLRTLTDVIHLFLRRGVDNELEPLKLEISLSPKDAKEKRKPGKKKE